MKKRIIPIIALSIIALLALTTIIFAVCTKSYEPNFKDFESITIAGKNVEGGQLCYSEKENKDDYNKMIELFDKSFNESALNSLFNGRLAYTPKIIKNTNTLANIHDLNKYITFNYDNDSNMPKFTYNEQEVSFNRVLVEVVDLKDKNVNLVKIYLLDVSNGNFGSSFYYETYSVFYDLFDYVNSLTKTEEK